MVQRPGQACAKCRETKRRCIRADAATPGLARRRAVACVPCSRRGVVCSYEDIHSQLQERTLSADGAPADIATQSGFQVSLAPARTPLPPLPSADMLELVDLYFANIHDQAYSLFHEPSFREAAQQGTAPKTVLMAMGGLCARFSQKIETRSRGPQYVSDAKKLLGQDIGHVSLENAQAAILLASISRGEFDSDASSIYSVIASRMVHILRLGEFNEQDDPVTREVKLRVWWTCRLLDTWSSRDAPMSRQLVCYHRTRPRLPMAEKLFRHLKATDLEPEDRGRGIWACTAELLEIYSDIQDLHLELATSQQWHHDKTALAVDRLACRMRAIEVSLKPDMSYNEENLNLHVAQGLGRAFLGFHLGYHHYSMLLFYIYLDQCRIVSGVTNRATNSGNDCVVTQTYADLCKYHANTVSDILRASRSREGCEVKYNIISHVAVVSSSVLLHTYLFGEGEDVPAAKDRLQSNFETLLMLKQYWPSVEMMTKRLVIFQDNCLRSKMREDSYRFDRWMTRFLVEHWLNLKDKLEESPASPSPTSEVHAA